MFLIPLALLALLAAGVWADAKPNIVSNLSDDLARAHGARAIGSGSNGPFAISKLNDGRTDSLGMWSSDSRPGAFGGIKFGDAPVAFNTVRFQLFNGRAAFTGWRLEGSDDVEIDEDPDPMISPGFALVHDPELIASDPDGEFVNASAKAHNTVTISFHAARFQAVRLAFQKLPGGARASVAVPELEVFLRAKPAASRAALTAQPGLALDAADGTITVPHPLALSELLARLNRPAGVTIFAHNAAGLRLRDADALTHGCVLVAKFQNGGGEKPFETEYLCYSIVDTSAPPPPPKPAKPPRAPRPPKPPVTIASAPAVPNNAVNLILGKNFSGSVRPESAARFAATGAGDWFLTQQIPQWIAVNFGAETEFNYFSIASAQVVHFVLQISDDAATWRTVVEVDRIRPPYVWNGYFEKIKAQHLRLIVLKPSWDVHIRKLLVANLAQPPTEADGRAALPLKPTLQVLAKLPALPEAVASPNGSQK